MSFVVVFHVSQNHVVYDFQSTVSCCPTRIAVPPLVRGTASFETCKLTEKNVLHVERAKFTFRLGPHGCLSHDLGYHGCISYDLSTYCAYQFLFRATPPPLPPERTKSSSTFREYRGAIPTENDLLHYCTVHGRAPHAEGSYSCFQKKQ